MLDGRSVSICRGEGMKTHELDIDRSRIKARTPAVITQDACGGLSAIADVREQTERRAMTVRLGRLLAGEWARKKPYYFLSPSPTLATAAFTHAGAGAASFCTDADAVQSSRVKIFDRDLKLKQRDRAAWLMGRKNDFVDSVAENLLDRLEVALKS